MNDTEDNSPESDYRLTTAGDLLRTGHSAVNCPTIILDASRVPVSLRHLIPLAERWGIADDVNRGDIFRHASPDELRDLQTVLHEYDDELDVWLAGPAPATKRPTQATPSLSASPVTRHESKGFLSATRQLKRARA